MAKFAKVTYGTHGDTKEYTYIVNDNVRSGDYLQPTVKHADSGKIFATTGIVQSTAKETSAKGKLMLGEITKIADEKGKPIEIENVYTGKELGIKPERTGKGTFATVGGLGKTKKDAETGMFQMPAGKDFHKTQYIEQTREANLKARLGGNEPKSSKYDEYNNKFKGD